MTSSLHQNIPGTFCFCFERSGAKNSKSNSHLPVQWGTRLRCRAQITCVCLFSFCSQTFGQSPPFAIRNRREKGGTQPITGFSPIGRGNVRLPRPPCRCPLLFLLVLRGIFRLLTFRPCVASIFRPGFAPRPFDYSSIGLMFHFWAKLGLVVLGPALPRGNLGGHLVLWLSPRVRPFNRAAA